MNSLPQSFNFIIGAHSISEGWGDPLSPTVGGRFGFNQTSMRNYMYVAAGVAFSSKGGMGWGDDTIQSLKNVRRPHN